MVLVSLLLATPAVLFWLWLVIVPARVAILCPEECKCDKEGYLVYCVGASLNALPLIRLTNVRLLLLQQNNITLLQKDSFVSLTELELLDVNMCRLRTIEVGAFNGLTKLKRLTMSSNNIRELLTGTFENMSSLDTLNLRGNNIKILDRDVFSGLGAFNGLIKLKRLFITGNEISKIIPGTFENMSSLDVLYLDRNKIEHLDSDVFSGLGAFNGLTKLTELSMRSNNIRELLTDTFESMSSLEKLDLSRNKIKNLDSDVFSWLVNLRDLNLGYNGIEHLDIDVFSWLVNLRDLNLGYNGIEHLDIDVFSGLVNLKGIHLQANKLRYLHPDTFLGSANIKTLILQQNRALQVPTDRNFINSHSLSELDISRCNVSSLSAETFANVSALGYLDITYNNLRTVDINILRSLPELSTFLLGGNSLQCDCQLQEVWRWCEDRNIQRREEPQCDTPREVKRLHWGVLENGQCLEGDIEFYGDYKSKSKRINLIWKQDYENDYYVPILKQYQVPLYAFPFIFGTTGNVILLIIIICNKDMRTVPNMYILNLAISDIIFLSVLFSEACLNRISDKWLDGEFMCTFLAFCRRMSVGLSAYSVVLYSFQRYRVIVCPFQVRLSSPLTWRGVVAEICGVWIVAALFAAPSTVSKNLCPILEDVRLITYYQHVVIFELLVSCVLPLCVIAFTYITTARHLVESSRAISEGTQNPQLNSRRNSAKIVVGLTVVFVISYVPFHVFWTYFICREENIFSFTTKDILDRSHYKLKYTYVISTIFLLINSCLNPVALFCTSSPFRQHLKRYITCFCKTNSPPTDLELARRN